MIDKFEAGLAVTFDFEAKKIGEVQADGITDAARSGLYCWTHLPANESGFEVLREAGVDENTIERISTNHGHGAIRFGRTSICCTLVEAVASGRDIELKPIHLVLGHNFLFTLCNGRSDVISDMCESYVEDFEQHARSGGFLLFELADALIFDYRQTLGTLATEVESIQRRLIDNKKDESIFNDFSRLSASLLEFRNAVAAARESVDGLSKRKSPYINEATQPFLERQAMPLDRLAGDAATERTILSETLNLYMGMIGYRTNLVVDRLTIVSMIFLPLNFLAAVYGMNFEFIPEFQWRYGYFAFWGLAITTVSLMMIIFKRRKWI
jgi:magnesium transporter